MSFFQFRLDSIKVNFQRGKIPDDDVVTFGIFVNQVDRGHGAGLFPSLISGSFVPAGDVQPDIRKFMSKTWIVGPFAIAPGDGVSVVYSGTNTSDPGGSLNAQQQAEVELKILDSISTAAVGAIGGPIAAAIGSALGFIGDPIGKLLGFSEDVPCNGPVFSDAVQFTGAGLEALPLTSDFVSFTRSYTDEATHNTSTCGHIAETDVTFSVLRLQSLSIRSLALSLFGAGSLHKGLRAVGAPAKSFSVKSVFGVQP